MFAIIGQNKQVARNVLIEMLKTSGFQEAERVVSEIERRGRAIINDTKIMFVK